MDTIDVAQRRQQEEIDHALANRRPVAVGLTHCERADCGEPISPTRQQMGARLCIDCATAQESEARRWAPRGQG
jgi:RNA polymerase-binding transcription factor DksA